MGIFSFFTRKGTSQVAPLEIKMTSAELLEEVYGGWESTAGIPITWRQAAQLSAVMACVRVIGNGIAQVPFVLFKRDGRQNTRAVENSLYTLIHDAPNDYMTSFDFRFTMGMHLILTNNFFAWVNRVGGRVIEILPLNNVQVQRDGWGVKYLVTGKDGKQKTLPPDEIWHVRSMAWDGVMGLDAIKLARNVFGLTLATETYGANFFKNGGRPPGVLSTPAILGDEQRKALRQDWEAMNAGMQNANRIAVIWGDLRYSSLASNNDQSQFLETRKFQIEEVCRALGVNPIKIFYSDKNSTYASVEQMNISHVQDTLMPIYANVEQSAAMSLLTEQERRDGYYVKLLANGLMRGTTRDRAEYYKAMRVIGTMTINEIRELEENNPLEGGDDPFVPLNSNVSAAGAEGAKTDGN